ncbi:VOC family protein [Aestuariicella hydrocarbonica]|uniref:VOC family protein n=1 Tax=Pseudomaricurvus hydrocarbonicus TaxID=1470433 RepID=A0A9E5JW91_9GAMM|nr:VOC family protein [Aestuariicella hydrocarbonica]NHO65685.1 VOC family protein [Aestuariicella hydrocarbonica]
MFEGQHYQNGYITRNIEKAIERFRQNSDVVEVASYEVPVEITTAKGKGTAVSKLAFIWVNNLQYELIEPVSGLVDVYTDELPDDDSVKFHHSCMRVADWDDFRSRVDEMGYPVVIEGGSDQLKFLYLDAREVVGHYLEYVWMTPERWKVLGGS